MCDVACLSRQRQVSITTARLCLRGPTYRTCRRRRRRWRRPSSSSVVVAAAVVVAVVVRRRHHCQSLSVVLFRRSLHRQRLIDVAYLVTHETVEHTVFTLRKFMRNCSSVCVASRYSLMFVAFLLVLSNFILCNVIYGVSNKMFSFNTSLKFNFCTAR